MDYVPTYSGLIVSNSYYNMKGYIVLCSFQSAITIKSFLVVPNITQGPTDIAGRTEESVTFICNATGLPLPSITWSSNSSSSIPVQSGDDVVIDGTTRQSQITLSNLQLDDFQNYTCTATNQYGNDSETALLGSECYIHTVLVQ